MGATHINSTSKTPSAHQIPKLSPHKTSAKTHAMFLGARQGIFFWIPSFAKVILLKRSSVAVKTLSLCPRHPLIQQMCPFQHFVRVYHPQRNIAVLVLWKTTRYVASTLKKTLSSFVALIRRSPAVWLALNDSSSISLIPQTLPKPTASQSFQLHYSLS